MEVKKARKLFLSLTAQYFHKATVIFAKQSRIAKPPLTLVTIAPGKVKRPFYPNYSEIDGVEVAHYLSRMDIQVDLFTNGSPVIDEDTGETIAYENTAMDDMLAFANFLNSGYVVQWSHKNDVSILLDTDVVDLTGLVNDNNYEYRARLTVGFYFTQKAVGFAAVLGEDSIFYPTGETDPETNTPIYSTEEPEETESTVPPLRSRNRDNGATVIPNYDWTSSNGGSQELADSQTGYFTKAEITEIEEEDTGNE